ncbi:MAG: hypothetical protein ACYC09_13950 [Bacteroidota bacterium]
MSKVRYTEHVAERLVKFGQHKYGSEYGWMSAFARSLQMTPQGLQPYLKGDRIPGSTLQFRLFQQGCSIDWLLFGKSISMKM